MAVYSTMIRDDPDSRARMRVTPEQILNLPVHFCLASWIAGGTRAASFIGQTFPFPRRHLRRLGHGAPRTPAGHRRPLPRDDGLDARARRRLATADAPASEPTPPQSPLEATVEPTTSRVRIVGAGSRTGAPTPRRRGDRVARRLGDARRRRAAAPSDGTATDVRRDDGPRDRAPRRRTTGPDHQPRPPRRRPTRAPERRPTRRGPAPDSLRELAFIDRINEIKAPEHEPPSDTPAAPLRRRLRDPRPARPRRARAALADRPRRPSRQGAQDRPPPPQQALRTRPRRPRRASASANARAPTAASRRSTPSPATASRPPSSARRPPCTRNASGARPSSAAPASLPHNLHALSWAIELHRVVGELATDYWRTPRYATGRYPVPQIGNGHKRHPITAARARRPRRPRHPRPRRRSARSNPTSRSSCASPASGSPSTCSSSSTSPAAPPTTTTSSAPTTPSSPAGRSPTRATGRSPRARSSSSSAGPARALACAEQADRAMTGRTGAMGQPRRTGTTPAATTPSSPPSPTSTTAPSLRWRSRRCRPPFAKDSVTDRGSNSRVLRSCRRPWLKRHLGGLETRPDQRSHVAALARGCRVSLWRRLPPVRGECRGGVAGGRRRRPLGRRGGELVLVELEEVVRRGDQAPFGADGGSASSVELLVAPRLCLVLPNRLSIRCWRWW